MGYIFDVVSVCCLALCYTNQPSSTLSIVSILVSCLRYCYQNVHSSCPSPSAKPNHHRCLLSQFQPCIMPHLKDCTLQTCPVSASVYGYRPSIPANAFFLAVFVLLGVAQLIQGIRRKTWFFGAMMVLGCAGEATGEAVGLLPRKSGIEADGRTGYAGRIILHGDVFSNVGYASAAWIRTGRKYL